MRCINAWAHATRARLNVDTYLTIRNASSTVTPSPMTWQCNVRPPFPSPMHPHVILFSNLLFGRGAAVIPLTHPSPSHPNPWSMIPRKLIRAEAMGLISRGGVSFSTRWNIVDDELASPSRFFSTDGKPGFFLEGRLSKDIWAINRIVQRRFRKKRIYIYYKRARLIFRWFIV